ncbi:SCO4848 family membrane protein [Protaetiibacter mangrovi]|uniref:Integral membrane protein n=1 Tax=Protaetiibacter mangrovi TaxID=2970926 RepID=A0ABT1ZIC4_9MICO|nr:hypothetical protein [Protaetiibacter mangrovi]MCS0500450.1 hypothetical protein [Protaetiibacter mangrovi]TPX03733.1 hypothetical protein FJ656_15600 [Schumannella luteola]
MIVALGILLLVSAVFNVLTWPTFLKRVARDPRAHDEAGRPTRFLRVHQALVAVAMLLAAASAVLGVWALVAG